MCTPWGVQNVHSITPMYIPIAYHHEEMPRRVAQYFYDHTRSRYLFLSCSPQVRHRSVCQLASTLQASLSLCVGPEIITV